jgi:hypothetical protein
MENDRLDGQRWETEKGITHLPIKFGCILNSCWRSRTRCPSRAIYQRQHAHGTTMSKRATCALDRMPLNHECVHLFASINSKVNPQSQSTDPPTDPPTYL